MTSLLNYGSSTLLGSLVFLGALGGTASADEYGAPAFVGHANRCAAYGPDFVAVEGSDACMRIGGRVRVQIGTNAGLYPNGGWTAGKASAATLRSYTPSNGDVAHVRAQGGAEYPGTYR